MISKMKSSAVLASLVAAFVWPYISQAKAEMGHPQGKTAATIKVGSQPKGVAVSSDGKRAYVVNSGENSVSVIDLGSGTEITKVAVGESPYDVALSPRGRAYVINNLSRDISVIDTRANTVVAIVNLGWAPTALAVSPDGNRVLVTNGILDIARVADSSSIIDGSTGETVEKWPVGGLDVTFSPDGKLAYLGNYPVSASTGNLSIVEPGGKVIAAVQLRDGLAPLRITLSSDGRRAYVLGSNYLGEDISELDVIDTASGKIVNSVSFEGRLEQLDLALTPDGVHLYLARTFENAIKIIDAESLQEVGSIEVDSPSYITFSADGKRAYATSIFSDSLIVIE
jgi:YVTN family beta-propeller protein